MTNDERASRDALLRLLNDIVSQPFRIEAAPESDAILDAYVGYQTRDGWAYPLPVTQRRRRD